MKIVLLADPHLSDIETTPQEAALDWALSELRSLSPSVCIWLGDITACGSLDAAMRFCKKISQLPCPSLVVPGNAELRTPKTASIATRLLFNYSKGLKIGDICFVGMDTSQDKLSAEEKARLERLECDGDIFLYSHQPPKSLDADSLEFIGNWISKHRSRGHRVLMWTTGHVHKYSEDEFEGVPVKMLRALDPDKCIGGSAHFCILEYDCGVMTQTEAVYTENMPHMWSDEERREFVDYLGITCYNKRLERDMEFAISKGVRHLEWRKITEETLPLLKEWRRGGGQSFSLHLPSLGFDTDITGLDSFKASALDAVRAEADMITVHPPCIKNGKMFPIFDIMADAMADALLPVANAHIDILVENNHTSYGTPNDPSEWGYGCLPAQLIGWRDSLNERLGKGSCHLRFDIGHARNNMPLSQNYPIGKWYGLIGSEVYSYHLHQTKMTKEDKRMHNHHPITGFHNGMVSFDGFLGAWHTGVLRHAPIILEVREGEGMPAAETWTRLRELILSKTE